MMSIESWMIPLAFQTGQTGDGVRQWGGVLLLWPAVFAIFYFLVWAPARKKQKDFQSLVQGLKRGDRVVTTGGLYGEVVAVDTATVILKIADSVKVKVAKSAISALEGESHQGDKQGDKQ